MDSRHMALHTVNGKSHLHNPLQIYFCITIDYVFASIPYWFHVSLFDKVLDPEKKNKASASSAKGFGIKKGKTHLR